MAFDVRVSVVRLVSELSEAVHLILGGGTLRGGEGAIRIRIGTVNVRDIRSFGCQ